MRFLKGLLFLFFLGSFSLAGAQDIHFTMFDMAPINLNPVYTGYYEGTFRIGGIYRSQWQGLGLNVPTLTGGNFSGFKTPSAFIDAPFGIRSKNNFDKMKNWAGIGVNFYNDKVDRLSTLRAELSLAYHLGFGQRGNTRLSFGLKGGIIQQRVSDVAGYVFEDELNNCPNYPNCAGVGSVDDGNVMNDAATVPDFSGGAMLAHRGTGFGFEIAAAVNHFTQPGYNFLNANYKLPMNFIGSARFDIAMGRKLSLRPMAFYQLMAKTSELNAQTLLAIHFNNTKDINFLVGGGYRLTDAAFARVGFELKGLAFGASYDFNLSSLSMDKGTFTGTNPRAMGFELALTYIAKIYKDPVVREILFNPRF